MEATAQKKFAALEKVLRRNIFVAVAEYFAQVSEICRARQEVCSKAFCRRVEKICDALTFLNQDFFCFGGNKLRAKKSLRNLAESLSEASRISRRRKIPCRLARKKGFAPSHEKFFAGRRRGRFFRRKIFASRRKFPASDDGRRFHRGQGGISQGKIRRCAEKF